MDYFDFFSSALFEPCDHCRQWTIRQSDTFKTVSPFFDRAKLEKQKVYVDRYGVWLALVSWLTALLMLLGKFLRFLFWNLLLGVF